MQETPYDSIELKFLETLITEENRHSDQNTIQMDAVGSISQYVNADEALFILFDFENPEMAVKKLYAVDPSWRSESTFLVKDSSLCSSLPDSIQFIDYAGRVPDLDPVVLDSFLNPIKSVILAPLSVAENNLGVMIFTNPVFNFSDDRRYKFLQLMVKGLSNAIFSVEHNRQLIISKADLEASQWEILNSRNTLRTFFDNIPTCVYIIDRSYTILAVNSRRSDRIGKAPNELVGRKCYERLFGNSTPCASCRVAEAFDGVPSVRNFREWGDKETFVHWEITTVPIRESNGVINRVIVFDEDITEKWVLEAGLIQSEKMASIGQLAANVAHEINNPLAAIIANSQLLLRDLAGADEDTIESLKLIESAGVRAAKIVGELLESARKEKKEEYEEISLNETILDALSMVNFEVKNRGIKIKLDLEEDMPLIFAHRTVIKGVWINLLTNALGAVETNRGAISISTRYEKQEYHIVFTDNGKGISPENQDQIFKPFFTTKGIGSGTGLGLYVSMQVIKEHHGDIHFESNPGKGTSFIIILPNIKPGE